MSASTRKKETKEHDMMLEIVWIMKCSTPSPPTLPPTLVSLLHSNTRTLRAFSLVTLPGIDDVGVTRGREGREENERRELKGNDKVGQLL